MRHILFLLLVLGVFTPIEVQAQPRLLVGGGVTAPNGDLSQSAEAGYHWKAGLWVAIPRLPVGFRADGALHRLSSADDGVLERTEVLAGSLSGVFMLPGVGLAPYLFGGFGRYRIESGPIDATTTVTDPGFHGGFGVNIGAGGLGAFAEIRYVQVNGTDTESRFIPLTFGLRF
jgi:hypothetical protein